MMIEGLSKGESRQELIRAVETAMELLMIDEGEHLSHSATQDALTKAINEILIEASLPFFGEGEKPPREEPYMVNRGKSGEVFFSKECKA
jgi:hypothetical protein